MSPKAVIIARQMLAAVLATAVFAVDLRHGFDVSIAVLYALVLVVAALGRTPRIIWAWMGVCFALAVSSFVVVHWSSPDLGSVLRLLFALVAIAITGLLLIGRYRLDQMRREVEHGREELQVFADSVPQMLWAAHPDGQCYFLNRRFCDFTGITMEEGLQDAGWTRPIHTEDRPGFLQQMEEAIRSGTEFRSYFRVRGRDGEHYWVYWVAAPYRMPGSDSIHRWYGGCANVDAQFKAQETIRELNHTLERRVEERTEELMRTRWRYRSLFQDRNIGVIEIDFAEAIKRVESLGLAGSPDLESHFEEDAEGLDAILRTTRVLEFNETYARQLGFDGGSEDLVARSPGENRFGGRKVLIRLLDAFMGDRSGFSATADMRNRNGEQITIAYAANLSDDDTAFITVVDITERQRAHELKLAAQSEMARANRVATVGALSVSLAHELNQPIASMSVDVETGMRTLEKEVIDRKMLVRTLSRIGRNTERLSGIVQRTRSQVSGRQQALAPLDLCSLAQETAVLLDRDISNRGARLQVKCGAHVPKVEGDMIEIQQVLVNLVMNALDAMAAQPVNESEIFITVDSAEPGVATVTVADTGPGIPDDAMGRIFQPFFTTKPDGIGMGLQICRWTIEALGGDLRVRNRPEGGAEFTIRLLAA